MSKSALFDRMILLARKEIFQSHRVGKGPRRKQSDNIFETASRGGHALIDCNARFGAQFPRDSRREIATDGHSVVALIAFNRLPRCWPRHAIGVQNKTQFNERTLHSQHQFAGRGRGGGLCGGPSRRLRRRLQQLRNFVIRRRRSDTRRSRLPACGCLQWRHFNWRFLRSRFFNWLILCLDWCNGGVRPRQGNHDWRCRAGAREKRRGMTGPLPKERIEEDCGDGRDENTDRENAQIVPAPPPCPA